MGEHTMPRHELVIDALNDIGPVYGESEGEPSRSADRAIDAACAMIREQAERIRRMEMAERIVRRLHTSHMRGLELFTADLLVELDTWANKEASRG